MCIPAKPVLLEVMWVSIFLCFFATRMESMCACRMCMHVFTLCVCVREDEEKWKGTEGRKQWWFGENKVIMGWESLAHGWLQKWTRSSSRLLMRLAYVASCVPRVPFLLNIPHRERGYSSPSIYITSRITGFTQKVSSSSSRELVCRPYGLGLL